MFAVENGHCVFHILATRGPNLKTALYDGFIQFKFSSMKDIPKWMFPFENGCHAFHILATRGASPKTVSAN